MGLTYNHRPQEPNSEVPIQTAFELQLLPVDGEYPPDPFPRTDGNRLDSQTVLNQIGLGLVYAPPEIRIFEQEEARELEDEQSESSG